ncbi:uncharacterized protein G2W53_017406 [Senna tora]|uniref:Uncharacterized protein n=1 Tax=Senna tora TaxID=362788 RepID=A0A834TRU3_9FABA|nr:uncharacterized protein G2W53_017406 [Senna tora]
MVVTWWEQAEAVSGGSGPHSTSPTTK